MLASCLERQQDCTAKLDEAEKYYRMVVEALTESKGDMHIRTTYALWYTPVETHG